MTLLVSGDVRAAAAAVEGAGGEVTAIGVRDRMLSAAVPEGRLRDLARLPGVLTVNEVQTPTTGAVGGSAAEAGAINACPTGVVTEGDIQLGAAVARAGFDVDGTGVKVGILSDSFDTKATGIGAADDVASGDLPGPGNPCGRTAAVHVLDDSAGARSDEGRAMAQIVHDVAPGAEIAFATGFGGEVAFANNIRALANAGANVIVDDVLYSDEPYYQDGSIANAIRDVTARGVAYFTMAFNNNRVVAGRDINSWEAPGFRSTSCPPAVLALNGGADSCMDFDPAPGAGSVDNTFGYGTSGSAEPQFLLQWGEPRSGVVDDLDAFVLDSGGAVVAAARTDDPSEQIPYESLTAPGSPACGSGPASCSIVIQRFSGSGVPRLKWIQSDSGAGRINAVEYLSSGGDVVGPTIYGHNGAASAQTVAAVPYSNSSVIEPFSSRGPVTHLFAPVSGTVAASPLPAPEVLSKPDVAATDGAVNTFLGSGNRFRGTSAAAPHAAAVAALQLEANPALGPAEVGAAQRATANPVGAFPATAQGAGLLDAPEAIALNPPVPPTAQATPPALTRDRTPGIGLATTGHLRALTCRIDARAAAPCFGRFSPSNQLRDGPHTITVTATDFFGQSGSGSASFRVDTRAPRLRIEDGPRKSSHARRARFAFDSERGARFECRVDRGRFARCRKAVRVRVGPGRHRLLVRAIDTAGNVSRAARYGWRVLPQSTR